MTQIEFSGRRQPTRSVRCCGLRSTGTVRSLGLRCLSGKPRPRCPDARSQSRQATSVRLLTSIGKPLPTAPDEVPSLRHASCVGQDPAMDVAWPCLLHVSLGCRNGSASGLAALSAEPSAMSEHSISVGSGSYASAPGDAGRARRIRLVPPSLRVEGERQQTSSCRPDDPRRIANPVLSTKCREVSWD